MITFRLCKANFSKNTFFAKKITPIAKTLNNFGYIKYIDKGGIVVAEWYYNYIKSELRFSIKELTTNYKSICPYYNTKFIRGNIWKFSYNVLLSKIHVDTGFSKIKVDKITYKKTPVKGNNVVITDAVYVLSNGITKLEGKLVSINKHTYDIRTPEGKFNMNRNSFTLLPQDNFILLSIRC